MNRRGFIKTIALLVVAIVVVGFLIFTLIPPEMGYPSETRRITHPKGGFSVVQPRGWEMYITDDPNTVENDRIRFLPKKSVGSPGIFSISKISKSPDEKELLARKYTPTTFMGKPAFEKRLTNKDTHEQIRNLAFERDGTWFEIAIQRPESESIDTGLWLAYAESFRIEPMRKLPTLKAPLPMSATLPTTTVAQ